jgi:hypothetical protein
MLASVHLVTGAAIGKSVRPFWLAAVAAFASHFVLDFIPHIDTHGLFGVSGGGPTRAEVVGTLCDVALGVALVLWVTVARPARAGRHPGSLSLGTRQPWRRAAIWAAFIAVVIDLVDNVPPWGPHFQRWVGTAWFSHFHHGIQHNLARSEWALGLAIQVAFLGIAIWVTRRRRPAHP